MTGSSIGALRLPTRFVTICTWHALVSAVAAASVISVPLTSTSWNLTGIVEPSLNTLTEVPGGSLMGCVNPTNRQPTVYVAEAVAVPPGPVAVATSVCTPGLVSAEAGTEVHDVASVQLNVTG